MAEYTAITPDGKYLLHYGVKGMRWGKKGTRKRTEKPNIISRASESRVSNNKMDYSNLSRSAVSGGTSRPGVTTVVRDSNGNIISYSHRSDQMTRAIDSRIERNTTFKPTTDKNYMEDTKKKKDSGSSTKSQSSAPETKKKKKKKKSSTKRTSNFKTIGRSNNTKN